MYRCESESIAIMNYDCRLCVAAADADAACKGCGTSIVQASKLLLQNACWVPQ